MPLTPDLLRAIELLDGTSDTAASPPTAPGLYWRPRTGHLLVVEAENRAALAVAGRAELKLFGSSHLAFGLGARFYDPAGNPSAWTSSMYIWRLDPGHWRVPTVEDVRLLLDSERIIDIVAAGDTPIARSAALPSDFVMYLRARVGGSAAMNAKPAWVRDAAARFPGLVKSGVLSQKTHERAVVDLLPVA
jgi:hypothetical protein